MKKPQIKRDGEKFYVDTSAGRVSADEVGGLTKLAMKIEENRPRPPEEFLAAWQDGIRLAGENLFEIKSDTIDSATDRNQLRPDHEVITASLGGAYSGEHEHRFWLNVNSHFPNASASRCFTSSVHHQSTYPAFGASTHH